MIAPTYILAAIPINVRTDLLVLAGFITLVAAAMTAMVLAESRRKRKIGEALVRAGFAPNMKPAAGEKSEFFRAFTHIESLKKGAEGLRWFATGDIDGLPAWAFEHTYTTGSGKNRSTQNNTVVAVRAPMDWFPFTLTPESLFHRLGEKLGMSRDLKLENAAFDKRWRVVCGNDETALAVLSKDVQEFLANAPQSEWWCVGTGCIACGVGSAISDRALTRLLTRPASLIEAMDPELREIIAAESA